MVCECVPGIYQATEKLRKIQIEQDEEEAERC